MSLPIVVMYVTRMFCAGEQKVRSPSWQGLHQLSVQYGYLQHIWEEEETQGRQVNDALGCEKCLPWDTWFLAHRKSTEISLALKKTFEAAILTELHPMSKIDIFVQVLQSDGSKVICMLSCATSRWLCITRAGMHYPLGKEMMGIWNIWGTGTSLISLLQLSLFVFSLPFHYLYTYNG